MFQLFMLMQQLPAPVTGTGMNELLWQQEALQVYNAMLARGYKQLAADWKAFYPVFHQAHPNLSVKQVESVFAGALLTGSLSKAISEATAALGKIPQAAATGAQNAAQNLLPKNPLQFLAGIADFFQALRKPQTWLRVVEVAAGGMVLYLGIKTAFRDTAIGGVARQAKSSTKTVAKTPFKVAAKVTPVGRAVSTTGRAARTVAKHERRVAASRTRQRAEVIRGKQRNFSRRELYP